MSNRIYGEKVKISADDMQSFWCKRASMYSEKGSSTVILGDQNTQRAQMENEFDQEHIMPQLNITKTSRVLDVGCGVGRVAEMILPQCGFYYGVDYSKEMTEIAKQVCDKVKQNSPEAGSYTFCHMSLYETVQQPPSFFGGQFDVYIMMGICMYMNDVELAQSFQLIPHLLKDQAIILFQESMGLNRRLTLDRISSEALQSSYSAIYRTKDEYFKLYEPLFEAGFSIVEEAQMPDFGNRYSDSERRFCIMKRG